jgi:large subunit ribosomal protein L19
MHPAIAQLDRAARKPAVAQVQSGDTVRVHQLIREGNKQRIQVFEGVVIRTDRLGSASASVTVRRIASNVGVEKTFLLHSPNIDKVEVIRRAKVRRNFLTYLRGRRGKSARLKELAFDKAAANVSAVVPQDDVAADEAADEAVTEIDVDQNQDELDQVEVSTEELANTENREAAADQPQPDEGGADQGDEQQAPAEEVNRGVDKAQPNNQ